MYVSGCSQQEHFAAIARCAATELVPQAQRRAEALAAEATSAKETAGHELALMRRQLSHAQSALAAAEKVQLWPPKALSAEGPLQLRLWAVPAVIRPHCQLLSCHCARMVSPPNGSVCVVAGREAAGTGWFPARLARLALSSALIFHVHKTDAAAGGGGARGSRGRAERLVKGMEGGDCSF